MRPMHILVRILILAAALGVAGCVQVPYAVTDGGYAQPYYAAPYGPLVVQRPYIGEGDESIFNPYALGYDGGYGDGYHDEHSFWHHED